MANNYMTNNVNDHVLEVAAPGVDYGLKNDDGFDPSKYDFYNPSNRSAATAFVVRLDEYVFTSDYSPVSQMLKEMQTEFDISIYTLRRSAVPFRTLRGG